MYSICLPLLSQIKKIDSSFIYILFTDTNAHCPYEWRPQLDTSSLFYLWIEIVFISGLATQIQIIVLFLTYCSLVLCGLQQASLRFPPC